MSISDNTGTARSFVKLAQSGGDQDFVCTNPPADQKIRLSTKSSVGSGAKATTSVLRQVKIEIYDPDTTVTDVVTANLVLRFPSRYASGNSSVQMAHVLLTRHMDATTGTIASSTLESNINNIILGVVPTP